MTRPTTFVLLLAAAPLIACGGGGSDDVDAMRSDAAGAPADAPSPDGAGGDVDAAGTPDAADTLDAPSPDGAPGPDAAVDPGSIDASPPAMTLYTVCRDDDQLRAVDPDTAATTSSIAITLANESVNGAVGLARHPLTGVVYALLDTDSGRQLVTLDTATGEAVAIGVLGDVMAAIAFDDAGTLYGVGGHKAINEEWLHTISVNDASVAVVMALTAGTDGEALGFSPDDGRLYRCSNPVPMCESIDVGLMMVSSVSLSGDPFDEPTALTWDVDNGELWLTDVDDDGLYRLAPTGERTFVGSLDHQGKGLVRAP